MSGALAPASPSPAPGGLSPALGAALQSALLNALQPAPAPPTPTPLQRFSQNLQDFGASLSTAANARGPGGFLTYGQGFAGPLGAGILGTQQAQQQRAALQSQMGLQQAQAGNIAAQTALTRLQLPMSLMRMEWGLNQAGGAQPMGGVQPPQAAPASLGAGIANVESGGNPQAVNSQGYSGAFQFGTAALNAAGMYQPAKGEDLTKNQWDGAITVPGFPSMTRDQFLASPKAQLAAWNQQQAYLTDQANKLGFGNYVGKDVGGITMTPGAIIAGMQFAGPDGMGTFLTTGGKYNPADKNNTTISEYIQKAQASQPAMPGQSYVPPGMPTPQQALAKAQQLFAMAQQADVMGYPGMAQTYRTQAQGLQDYGLSAVKPFSTYRGGLTYSPLYGWVRPGQMTNLQTPSGSTVPAWEVPPINAGAGTVPGSVQPAQIGGAAAPQQGAGRPALGPLIGYTPPGSGAQPGAAAAQPLVTKISPGNQKLITELADDYANEGRSTYAAAVSTKGWLTQMQQSLNQLNGPTGTGWTSTGTGNEMRMTVLKGINGALQSVGIQGMDQDAVGGWEELNKATRTAGMQLVKTMFGGSREAATIVQSATASVPGAENSPKGALRVLNGLDEAANEEIDRYVFETNWINTHDGSLIGADAAFNQQRSPAMYARRAISGTDPYKVTSADQALKSYLPGTLVQFPNGQIARVPGNPSLTLQGPAATQ